MMWSEKHVNGPEGGSDRNGGNVARIKSDRHLGTGSNTLFVDSHVERRSRDTLKDIGNWDDRTYNEWRR